MTVKKEKTHPVAAIFNADGTYNRQAHHAGQAHYDAQEAAGHYRVENGAASEHDLGNGRKRIQVSFDQVETNPAEPAA